MPAGQYMWNFTFQIPDSKTPSSFQYISFEGDSFSVQYTITVHFNDSHPLMTQTKSINIVSRYKLPRRSDKKDNTQKSVRTIDQATASSMKKKNKEDLTFQNFDEIATPNKVGFDSLESAMGEPSKSEI